MALGRSVTLIIGLACLGALAVLAMLTNVSSRITADDVKVFTQDLGLQPPNRSLSYEDEIALIRKAQATVFRLAPSGQAIPETALREPRDLMRHGSGVCYDHARTFEKLYTWLGFEARRVYLLYPQNRRTQQEVPRWRAVFERWTTSHAVTEVRTSRGWLIVNSTSSWISISAQGEPLSAEGVAQDRSSIPELPDAFNREYIPIRGLYSRQGQLYPPHWPFPDLNWWDLGSWLLRG